MRREPRVTAGRMVQVLALVCIGCASPEPPNRTVSSWALEPGPVLTISDANVPPGHELMGILSARRLSDGRIILANTGGAELLVFDSSGVFQEVIGRKGGGPGEFQSSIALFGFAGDSLAVFDAGNGRWTILSPALVPVRTAAIPDSGIPSPTWLYQGAIVLDDAPGAAPAWVLRMLAAARAADPEYHHLMRARRDGTGALWINDPVNPQRWIIQAKDGVASRVLDLPLGLELRQTTMHHLLGVHRDADGVESVELFRMSRPDSVVPPADEIAVRRPVVDEGPLRSALMSAVTAQEMYYAGHARYAEKAEDLESPPPAALRLFILEGDKRHWAGVMVDRLTGGTCGVSIGWPAPPGWVEGEVHCGIS